jgi:CubicO group peptidase (beta-lactamase class C family)
MPNAEMTGTGYRVPGAGCRVPVAGCRLPVTRRDAMTKQIRTALSALTLVSVLVGCPTVVGAQSAAAPYFPPAGSWARKAPAELDVDPVTLADAVRFAESRESTRAVDYSDQERIFGSMLGSVPTRRSTTNGVVIYRGYVIAEFGDTTAVDPTYSAAKSMMATLAGIAVRDRRLTLDEPVGRSIKDGGYDSAQNARVTWRMHLQQESEWEGELFGKRHDFVGRAAFGEGERAPRALQAPGTFYEYNDVRMNRLGLSLLRTFGTPLPEVFRTEVMDPIGASSTWKWVPYANSWVDVGGARMPSVSGGTRWGGGMWIHAYDMARFGYLWLRAGMWRDRRILPEAYVRASVVPSAHGPDYGYLWWLNTQGKNYPGLPATTYGARGAFGNTITIVPDRDLVVVLRWHQGNEAAFVTRVIDALR